jgi:hypothetical protein
MPYPDDLLVQAYHLAELDRGKPKQANLRRAISSAYSALFHLLLTDVGRNWKISHQRDAFVRIIEHGKMKAAAKRIAQVCEKAAGGRGQQAEPAKRLAHVLEIFERAQSLRLLADYDACRLWVRVEVQEVLDQIGKAFANWKHVRDTRLAQEFLLAMFTGARGGSY